MAEQTAENSETKTAKKKSEDLNTSSKKELKLTDLKVVDLRNELENRGLDKSGVKAALVERLRKALEEDGQDPDEYLFDTSAEAGKKSKRIEESLNDSKLDNDDTETVENDWEEEEDEKPLDENMNENSESGEILQLGLDDKEANLDVKESSDVVSKCSDTEDNAEQNSEVDKSVSDEIEKSVSDVSVDKEAVPNDSESKTSEKSEGKKAIATEDSEKALPPKNIWIMGLSSATRAADLKALFSKQGKVVSVKIVTNARQVSGEKKYYGFITMSNNKDAVKAVEALHNTELNEQMISLELTHHQPGTLLKKASAKPSAKKTKAAAVTAATTTTTPTTTTTTPTASPTSESASPSKVSTSKAKKDESKDGKTDGEDAQDKEERSSSRRDRDREHRSRDGKEYRDYRAPSFRRPFGFRGRGRGRGGFSFRDRPTDSFRRPFGRKPFYGRASYRPPMKPNYMSFKLREERERLNRDRFRERETERRRAQEDFHHKLIERKHREEAYRLEREKVQLRIEREMLERERAEILKMEREKQRVERERLEREKEKLRRQTQLREVAPKRPFPGPPDADPMWEKEKRPRHYERPYQNYPGKPGIDGGRQDYREPGPPQYNRRPDHYERDGPSTSRPDFTKYGKDKVDPNMRDHDERRVYKRTFFKDDAGARSYPPRETDRYQPPSPDDRFKRKIHDMRSPRSRGGGAGGSGRRMPYY